MRLCKPARRSLTPAFALILLLESVQMFAGTTLAINPTSINFGSTSINTSKAQNVVILNNGTGNLTVASAAVSGAGFSETGLVLPLTLAAGQSAAFQMTFKPTTLGSVSGTITLKKSNGTVLGSVALSGTGSDTTAPKVSVTAPANGTTIAGTVALTASASDNVGVVGVQFFVNGTAIGAEDTVAPFSVNWDTTAVSNGTGYLITARARDAAGNKTTSSAITTTVNNVTPVQHSVNLNWAASTSSVVGYYVYRSTQTGGPYSRITTTTDPATLYTDSTVTGGQVYYYVVTAVDGNAVESSFSNETVASIPQ